MGFSVFTAAVQVQALVWELRSFIKLLQDAEKRKKKNTTQMEVDMTTQGEPKESPRRDESWTQDTRQPRACRAGRGGPWKETKDRQNGRRRTRN